MIKKPDESPRRLSMNICPMGTSLIRQTRPWVPTCWSIAMPGFGHFHLGGYTTGVILMSGEIIFNNIGKINLAILYTFTLQFEKAHEVINYNCALLCAIIYLFGIWDSYRLTVESNNCAYLVSKEKSQIYQLSAIHILGVNFVNKRIPWVGVFWSILFPGLGHLYAHQILKSLTLILSTVAITAMTQLGDLILLTLTGQFNMIQNVNYQWLLFLPSFYLFSMYDVYSEITNINNLYKEEQLQFLLKQYGKKKLILKP
ncbi:hypothetical protein E3U55_12000 [Filobacillus milosensis]|uniref:Uncharacterized protein n=1 Tax=Filobacillus milosensis TaxID=94137 RepID=A0A4Y8IF23_9BACI|nr:hypothetical protein [Filobacillus milosensis]TFB18508.1 hypothetical protein E3U55_12000 [Filobacillus milosensis]